MTTVTREILSPLDGQFLLQHLINPGRCPRCGRLADQLWSWTRPGGVVIPVACVKCVGRRS
jgi:hypothetical protein